MKTVSNILNKKASQYNMVEAGTNVMNALSLMNASHETFIIVTREDKYAGIVSERDYAQKVILAGKSSQQTKVEDIMNCNLPAVSSTDSIERCMMLMNAYRTRYLPVFDDFEFKNVITMNDLISLSIINKEYRDLVKNSSDKVF
jgi:CBS domain-containing protein